jgi:hypothetical protein
MVLLILVVVVEVILILTPVLVRVAPVSSLSVITGKGDEILWLFYDLKIPPTPGLLPVMAALMEMMGRWP